MQDAIVSGSSFLALSSEIGTRVPRTSSVTSAPGSAQSAPVPRSMGAGGGTLLPTRERFSQSHCRSHRCQSGQRVVPAK